MSNEHKFLITYGLHNFVAHVESERMYIFTIRGVESQKLINHAKSLITANYGDSADIRVA